MAQQCGPGCQCGQCTNPLGKVEVKKKIGKGCRCGVNSKKTSCVNAKSCPCLKLKTGCGPSCGCKDCGNPLGQRPKIATKKRATNTIRRNLQKVAKFKSNDGKTALLERGHRIDNALMGKDLVLIYSIARNGCICDVDSATQTFQVLVKKDCPMSDPFSTKKIRDQFIQFQGLFGCTLTLE